MMNFFQRYLNLVYVSPRLITCVLDSNNNKGCETRDFLVGTRQTFILQGSLLF